jgi:hypothetical protein
MRSILTGPNFIICEGQDQLAALRRITSAAEPNKRPSPQPTALSPSAPTLHSATTMAAAVAVPFVAPLAPRETCLGLPTFIAPPQPAISFGGLRSNSGTLAMFAAILLASSTV